MVKHKTLRVKTQNIADVDQTKETTTQNISASNTILHLQPDTCVL